MDFPAKRTGHTWVFPSHLRGPARSHKNMENMGHTDFPEPTALIAGCRPFWVDSRVWSRLRCLNRAAWGWFCALEGDSRHACPPTDWLAEEEHGTHRFSGTPGEDCRVCVVTAVSWDALGGWRVCGGALRSLFVGSSAISADSRHACPPTVWLAGPLRCFQATQPGFDLILQSSRATPRP